MNTSNRFKVTINIYDILFYLALIMMIGFFAVTPLRNMQVRHIFVLGGSLVMYCISLYQVLNTKYSKAEFFRLAIIILLLISGVIVTPNSYLEVIYAYLDFLALYIILTTSYHRHLKIYVGRILYYFSLIITVCLFAAYLSPAAYIFEDGRSTKALVLGMTNPNLTGMMVTGVIGLIMICYRERKHKIWLALITCGLFYLAWLTNARSSLVACVLVIVYTVFLSNKKIPNFIIWLIVIGSIMFVPVYLTLYYSGFTNIRVMGKILFSGRELTYQTYLNVINSFSSFLFGNLGKTVFTNAHNAPLMIICSIGIFGLIATYTGFLKNLLYLNNSADNASARVAIACILSVCIQSCGEAIMFSGIFPSIGFIYIYMLIAAQNKKIELGQD